MTVTYLVLFPDPHLRPSEAVFWFMMQIAMLIGYCTAYPANQWLLSKGAEGKDAEFAGSRPATGSAGPVQLRSVSYAELDAHGPEVSCRRDCV